MTMEAAAPEEEEGEEATVEVEVDACTHSAALRRCSSFAADAPLICLCAGKVFITGPYSYR